MLTLVHEYAQIIVRDFVAEMPKQRPVRLVQLLPHFRADRVVRLGDIQCDLAIIVPGQDLALAILAGRWRQEVEGQPGLRRLGLALNGQPQAQKAVDQPVLGDLDALPAPQILGQG